MANHFLVWIADTGNASGLALGLVCSPNNRSRRSLPSRMFRHSGETYRLPWSQYLIPWTDRIRKRPGLSSYFPMDSVGMQQPIGPRLQLSFLTIADSHGSQLCTHLASTGRVVLAMEHRDGTCPVSRPRSEKTGEHASLLYIRSDEVVYVRQRQGFCVS